VPVLETDRLALRRLTTDDTAFILELLNDPSFLRHIGDKGVRNTADAVRYIQDGPLASYERFGFGLYLVERKDGGEPIGICGLLKRESLEDPDLGFAFLPRFWRKGYALESASAVLAHAGATLGLKRILAITSPGNVASINLLVKIGFRADRVARLSADEEPILVFSRECAGGSSTP
jgi:RimJ/RimL family protein N-acetyltransferase